LNVDIMTKTDSYPQGPLAGNFTPLLQNFLSIQYPKLSFDAALSRAGGRTKRPARVSPEKAERV